VGKGAYLRPEYPLSGLNLRVSGGYVQELLTGPYSDGLFVVIRRPVGVCFDLIILMWQDDCCYS
jgi:hypothetical protein